jgi:hypothetical protein
MKIEFTEPRWFGLVAQRFTFDGSADDWRAFRAKIQGEDVAITDILRRARLVEEVTGK